MATVSTLGSGSGLPLAELLSSLVAAEAIPLTSLQTKSASVQSQISAYGQLKSAVSSLQTALTALDDSKFTSIKVASSDATVATVSADAKAKALNSTLEVTSLATTAKVVSAPLMDSTGTQAKATSVIGTGKLVFRMGTAATSPDTFTPGTGEKDTFTVEIGTGEQTLEGIRDAVNKAKGPVTATILNDAAGARLVFTSANSGTAGNFKIEATDDAPAAGRGLAQFAFDPTNPAAAGQPTRTAIGADAQYKLDGIALTSASNTVSTAIDGISITLLKAGGTTNLTSTADNSAPKTALTAIVTAYNALADRAKTYTATAPQGANADPSARNDAVLAGDPTVRSMMDALRNEIFTPLSGAPAPYNSLTSLGLTFDRDGKLSLNDTIFNKAMTDAPDAVRQLFTKEPFGTGTVSLSKRIADMAGRITNDTDGVIKTRVNGLTDDSKALTKQQEALQTRVAAVEARYRAQFIALDSAIASMKNTSSYLSTQLSQLASLR